LIEFLSVDPSDAAALTEIAELFAEYQRELGVDLGFQGWQTELASLPGKYAPPAGRLYRVTEEGQLLGCAALRPLEPGIAEVKRMYLRPAARGRGLAMPLLTKLVEDARAIGYERLRLDTLKRLQPAYHLYRRFGFEEIPPYNFNPEPDIVYFELKL